MKVTPKNLETVLDNFKKFILSADKVTQKDMCNTFNDFLEELKNDDCFGTEGQLDPRGDNRNN